MVKIFKTKTEQQQKMIKQQCKLTNYRNMYMYCQNCKIHTGNTFPKKLVLVSNNKIKGKSKCAICFSENTFIHEIEDKYGLESELEIYLQFFTD